MATLTVSRGRNALRGGGHGLHARGGGASHEGARSDAPGDCGAAYVGPGRRHSGLQPADDSAHSLAAAAFRLSRSLGPAPADSLAQARPGCRRAAPARALSRAVPGLQCPPLPPTGPAPARRALLLRVREESLADGRVGGQAPAPGPSSPTPGAARLLRRAAASRWQSASLAGVAPRALVH